MDARHIVAALSPLSTTVARLQSLRVQPRSRAAADGKLRVGRYAWEMASTKLASAADHLEAWNRLIGALVIPTFAHYSLLRTALETSAIARWIVAPDTQSERTSRGVGAQREDLTERKKFEDAGRRHQTRLAPEAPGKSAVERLVELEKLASRYNIRRVETNVVDACRDYGRTEEDKPGAGEILYRLLSGATHGYQWVALPLSEHDVFDSSDALPSRTARLTANPRYAVAATMMVVDVFVAAVDELQAYSVPRSGQP